MIAVIDGEVSEPVNLVGPQSIKGSLEVVQNDGVRQALEDKRQFPERVQPVGESRLESAGDRADVEDDEADTDEHGDQHNGEARRDAADLRHGELIPRLDVIEERNGCENPPGIAVQGQLCCRGSDSGSDSPAKGLERPSVFEDIIDVVEVGEVGIYFHHPVWLNEDDGADEEPARISRQEWLDLHPGNNIMQGPGRVEGDGAD